MSELVVLDGPRLDRVMADTYPIWNDGLSRSAYSQWYEAQRRTPWGSRHLDRFALVDGDAVLASAKTYRFAATLDGRAMQVIGIGAVFTSEAYRGHGYAPALIERLLERAAADGIGFALLFSEIEPDYYRRLGFVPVAAHDVTITVTEPPGRGAPAMLVRYGDDRDLAAVVEMGQVRAASYRFHLNRDRDLVQYGIVKKRLLAGLGTDGSRHLQFFVTEEGGNAVAYVVITEQRGDWTLEECGDRDPSGARIGAMLQVLVGREPGRPRPLIRGWLPPRVVPPQVTILETRDRPEIMMIRSLGAERLPVEPLQADDVLYYRSDIF